MIEHEIEGTSIMVHPLLTDDPHERMGQVGVVTYADLQSDDFYVNFGDKQKGRYSANALLMLKKPEEINQTIENRSAIFSAQVIKDLQLIAQLQKQKTRIAFSKAFEIAQQSDTVLNYATVSIEDAYGIQPNHQLGR